MVVNILERARKANAVAHVELHVVGKIIGGTGSHAGTEPVRAAAHAQVVIYPVDTRLAVDVET